MAIAGLGCTQGAPAKQPPQSLEWAGEPSVVYEPANASRAGLILSKLRVEKAFDEDKKFAITASSEAFTALGIKFAASPDGKELLSKQEINILIPANGILLSHLDMVFELLNRPTNVKKVNMTLTEVDQRHFDDIDKHIKDLDKAWDGIDNVKVTGQLTTPKKQQSNESLRDRTSDWPAEPADASNNDQPKLKTISFDYTNKLGEKVQIVINYEYKMSGEKYFREETGNEADITIMHDIGDTYDQADERGSNTSRFLAYDHGAYQAIASYNPAWNTKPHYVVLSDDHRGEFSEHQMGSRIITDNNVYGCGLNHFDKQPDHVISNGSQIIKLDTETLSAIHKWGGQEAIEAYAFLIAGRIHNRKHEGPNLLLAHRFTYSIRTIYNFYKSLPPESEQIKKTVHEVMERFVTRVETIEKLAGPEIKAIIKELKIHAFRPMRLREQRPMQEKNRPGTVKLNL